MSVINKIPAVVWELYGLFKADDWELALVGGWVRDAILGDPSHDIDLATNAYPDVILEIVSDWADEVWPLGAAFGTIAMRKGDDIIEITTYRADTYDGASRKPTVIFGTNLLDDLKRRDFTINAMAVLLPDGFIDPHCGSEDLRDGILRTPIDPKISITDDPLRILRAARFMSRYNLAVDVALRNAMTLYVDRLDIVSAERQSAELEKLVMLDDPHEGLRLLVSLGILKNVRIDLLDLLPGKPSLALRLAALFYDQVNIRQLMSGLRFPGKLIKNVETIVSLTKSIAFIEGIHDIRKLIIEARDCLNDILELADKTQPKYQHARNIFWEVMKEDLSDPMNGLEIMQLLGIESGREVGAAIAHMRHMITVNGSMDKDEMSVILKLWHSSRYN